MKSLTKVKYGKGMAIFVSHR